MVAVSKRRGNYRLKTMHRGKSMEQIIMTVETSSCETNVGEVRAILDGGSCRIDWGDGTDLPYKPDGQELHAQHTYPETSEEAEEIFVIRIYSDEENIIGIYAECGDMRVKDIDISGCQTLKYFNASFRVDYFDLRTNPGITKVDITGDSCGIADFSNSLELKELSISYYSIFYNEYRLLDLSKCAKLEKLKCTAIVEPIEIKLPKWFPLKEFVYDDNVDWGFSRRQLEKIVKVIEHNNGRILKDKQLWEFPHSETFLRSESEQKCLNTGVSIPSQIKIEIAIQSRENIANIPLLLDGGSCEIDWGDGHKSMLYAETTEWLNGMHIYSRKCASLQVLITSETDNIIGMIADNWTLPYGISVNAIDMSKCRSLQYFAANGMTRLDINTNPGIRIMDLLDCRCRTIDFSNSSGLEHLYIRSGMGGKHKLQSLDLTKCVCLQTLGLDHNLDLTDVKLSENSFLKGLVYGKTPLSESTVRNLTRIIERNDGKVIKVPEDDYRLTYYMTMSDNGKPDPDY